MAKKIWKFVDTVGEITQAIVLLTILVLSKMFIGFIILINNKDDRSDIRKEFKKPLIKEDEISWNYLVEWWVWERSTASMFKAMEAADFK